MHPLLPRSLYKALKITGIDLSAPSSKENFVRSSTLNGSLSLKLAVIHLPILIQIAAVIFQTEHTTFLISTFFDLFSYLIPLDLLIRRRKKVLFCLEFFRKIDWSSNVKISKIEESKKVNVLLNTAICFTLVYFVCLFSIAMYDFIKDFPPADNYELISGILSLINPFWYCLTAYLGNSIFVIFFVHMSSLLCDILLKIEKGFNFDYLEPDEIAAIIKEKRIVYCRLQKLSSIVDSIFNDIIAVWLIKVIFRFSTSTVDILTRSWTNETETPSQVIVLLDTIYDLTVLLTVCHFGGKVQERKDELLTTLVYKSSKCFQENGYMQMELHCFISIIGHSNLYFTIGNLCFLNKMIAMNILGALASYFILIYQLTSNN